MLDQAPALVTAQSFGDSLDEASRDGVQFGIHLVLFLVILAVGWVIAKVLSKLTDTALERVGFDQAVERGGIHKALARSSYDASDLVAKLVYYGLLLVTLVLAFDVFGTNPVSTLLAELVAFLPNLVVAIVIVVVVAAIANAVRDLVTNLLSAAPYAKLVGNSAWALLIGLGVIAALQQVEVAVAVTQALLVALLATLGGVIVVGVGGGLVLPMSKVWQQWIEQIPAQAKTARQTGPSSAPTTPETPTARVAPEPAVRSEPGATEDGPTI